MVEVNTSLVGRLKERDADAWLELWEVFGPTLERMVASLARPHFSPETVQDIRQETLLQVLDKIGSFDAGRGVKFTTWLYAIAKHIVCAELSRRNALKRNRGVKPLPLEAVSEPDGGGPSPAADFERQVFRAKVYRAIRLVAKESGFLEFEVYKMKISRPIKAVDIAAVLGISEASVSRYLRKVRTRLREVLRQVVREYSWTDEEVAEIGKHSLDADDELFDTALGDIYAAVEEDQKCRHGPRAAQSPA
ncbi:MAG: sigma-70 family RNA polymerase sigma factor [Planctomycetes bacterium]|nr:sigma-70 family RNA polymerase sigma factor [Planctomycetota bacterium]